MNPNDVINFAAAALAGPSKSPSKAAKPRKIKTLKPIEEPPWHVPQILLTLSGRANLSNQTQISTALAVPGRSLDDLRTARNFFAHRSYVTADKVRAMAIRIGLPKAPRAAILLAERQPGKPYSILSGWLADMRSITRLMCQ
ncbi:MAG: hypothetical protein ACHQ9S_11845 [Candidatus Binatia bacterium]